MIGKGVLRLSWCGPCALADCREDAPGLRGRPYRGVIVARALGARQQPAGKAQQGRIGRRQPFHAAEIGCEFCKSLADAARAQGVATVTWEKTTRPATRLRIILWRPCRCLRR